MGELDKDLKYPCAHSVLESGTRLRACVGSLGDVIVSFELGEGSLMGIVFGGFESFDIGW